MQAPSALRRRDEHLKRRSAGECRTSSTQSRNLTSLALTRKSSKSKSRHLIASNVLSSKGTTSSNLSSKTRGLGNEPLNENSMNSTCRSAKTELVGRGISKRLSVFNSSEKKSLKSKSRFRQCSESIVPRSKRELRMLSEVEVSLPKRLVWGCSRVNPK